MRLQAVTTLGPNPVRAMRMGPGVYPLPDPIVGVLDSGIDTSNPWLGRLVAAQERHIPDAYANFNHGTLVGALAASGGGFGGNPGSYPMPVARLVDIQLIGNNQYDGIDEDDLVVQVEDVVSRLGPKSSNRPNGVDRPVVIWNLSLAADSPTPEDSFSHLAYELDRIAKENEVIFTIAAGNYTIFPLRGWTIGVGPDRVRQGADRVAPPGDAALAVTVGSISDSSVPPSASPVDYPSPFSRRGPGAGMLVKPEVVHYGGTSGHNGEWVSGIRGPARNGSQLEDIGTSFAAPRVAAAMAELMSHLPNPDPELLKVLLLLSCERRGDLNLEARDSVNYYGYGVPGNAMSVLTCEPWECIVLLSGDLRPGRPLKTPFPFPSSLAVQGTRRGHVKMVLVYHPVLDPTKGAEYCQTNVTASLGRQFDYPERDPRRHSREIDPIPRTQPTGSPLEQELIEQAWKWSPLKVYERTFHRMHVHPKEIGWRLSLDLLLRRELEPLREDVRQRFWLGIRIVDPLRQSNVYQELRQELELQGLAVPIQLRPQVRAT